MKHFFLVDLTFIMFVKCKTNMSKNIYILIAFKSFISVKNTGSNQRISVIEYVARYNQ